MADLSLDLTENSPEL